MRKSKTLLKRERERESESNKRTGMKETIDNN